MTNMKSILLSICMFSSTILLSLNEEELAKMSLQELIGLQYEQQVKENEIEKKSILLNKKALELNFNYLKAKEQCESISMQNLYSLFRNQACADMKDWMGQLDAQNIMQKRENIKLKYSKLDSQLIGTYIAERRLNS